LEYLIKNGYVYDPANNVKGEKMDIAIKDGKIVMNILLTENITINSLYDLIYC